MNHAHRKRLRRLRAAIREEGFTTYAFQQFIRCSGRIRLTMTLWRDGNHRVSWGIDGREWFPPIEFRNELTMRKAVTAAQAAAVASIVTGEASRFLAQEFRSQERPVTHVNTSSWDLDRTERKW